MFATPQVGAHVCLRCQSRASRLFLSVARTYPRNERHFSRTRATLLDLPLEPVADRVKRKRKDGERRIYPQGKLRGKKGGEVRESSELLSVESLGKPAEIILLKDADLDRTTEDISDDVPAHTVQEEARSSKAAILESIRGENAAEEVPPSQAIEEMRQGVLQRDVLPGTVLSSAEYDQLSRTLKDGFTTAQLRDYLSEHHKGPSRRTGDKLIPHSDWRPGISQSDTRNPVLMPGRKLSDTFSKIPKTVVVQLIMERAWKFRAPLAMGEMDVHDKQEFSQAVDEYGNSILDQIAKERDITIHRFANTRYIRLIGLKDACMTALEDISRRCRLSMHDRLQFVPVKYPPAKQKTSLPKVFLEGSLSRAATRNVDNTSADVVQSLTGVKLTLFNNHGQILLNYSGYSPEQMNDAQRALFYVSDLQHRSKHEFLELGGDAPCFRSFCDDTGSLAYYHRAKAWHRSQHAAVRDPDGVAKEQKQVIASEEQASTAKDDVITTTLSEALLQKRPSTQAPAADANIWSSTPSSIIGSKLGHVLWSTTSTQEASAVQGLFSPGLPYHDAILESQPLARTVGKEAPTAQNTISFVFRHHPQPEKGAKFSTKFRWQANPLPEIRADFAISAHKSASGKTDASLQSIYAIVHDHHACAALPSKPVDVAAFETHLLSLDTLTAVSDGHLSAALEEMKTSILGASRIRAPSSLDVPIPKSWLAPNTPLPAFPGTEEFTKHHLKANYRFIGVEHKQALTYTANDGRNYTFESVESGKLGPKYMQLSTHDTIVGDQTDAVREKRIRAAVTAGLNLVHIADRAARNLPVQKQSGGSGPIAQDVSAAQLENDLSIVTQLQQSPESDRIAEVEAEDHSHIEEEQYEQRTAAAG